MTQLGIDCSIYCTGVSDYLGRKILLVHVQNEFYLAERTNSKPKTTVKILEENKENYVVRHIMLENIFL